MTDRQKMENLLKITKRLPEWGGTGHRFITKDVSFYIEPSDIEDEDPSKSFFSFKYKGIEVRHSELELQLTMNKYSAVSFREFDFDDWYNEVKTQLVEMENEARTVIEVNGKKYKLIEDDNIPF